MQYPRLTYKQKMTSMTQMKILTWNIQQGLAADSPLKFYRYAAQYLIPSKKILNLDRIAEALQAEDADIAALQEVDSICLRSGTDQAEYIAKKAGYDHVATGINTGFRNIYRMGNATLSKHPFVRTENHALPEGIEQRGVLEAFISIYHSLICVLNTHLSLGKSAAALNLNHLFKIMPAGLNTLQIPYIIAGDFNAAPEELSAMLPDNIRPACKQDTPTFPSWDPRKQLDHILVSGSLDALECDANHSYNGSDHLPLIARINVI